MPDKLRAGGAFPFILEGDRAETKKPQFQIRVLSVSQHSDLISLRDQFIDPENADKRRELVEKMIGIAVEEIVDKQCEPLAEVLTEREHWELIAAAIDGAALTAEERKKFVSPPQSETD